MRGAQEVGGFLDALAGDALLGQRLAQRGLRARHVPEYLVTCAYPPRLRSLEAHGPLLAENCACAWLTSASAC